MTFALGAGTIRIDVTTTRSQACAVALSASRPKGLARMFVGRGPDEAPVLASQIFSLCGFAQSVAARLALLAASGRTMAPEEKIRVTAGLLAERIFETLRAFCLNWPTELTTAWASRSGPHLRQVLVASQAIIAASRRDNAQPADLVGPTARLKQAAEALGVPQKSAEPAPGSHCAAILAETRQDRVFRRRRPDALATSDDAEVISRLCTIGTYSELPFLAGRVAETGAYARLWLAAIAEEPYLAARFLARLADLRLCLDRLERLDGRVDTEFEPLMADGSGENVGGFGAVECARGRLYHQAELGADGKISAYRILAPTEWNFHPAGPFVETLLSCKIGSGAAGREAVSRLAALFDPCVAFEINVCEATDA